MARLGLDPTLFPHLVDPGDVIGAPAAPRRRAGRRGRAGGRGRLARHGVRGGRRADADRRRGVHLARHLGPGRHRARHARAHRGGPAGQLHQRGRRGRHDPLPHQRDGHLAAQRDVAYLGRDRPGRRCCDRPRRPYDGPVPVFDVQDPRFLPPGDMPARLEAWCAEHDVAAAERTRGHGAVHRREHRGGRRDGARASGRAGWSHGRRRARRRRRRQNTLLCQAIADRTGLPVLAGPVEATAIGNVLVQARAAGVVGPDLADLRGLVARTHDLARFTPRA